MSRPKVVNAIKYCHARPISETLSSIANNVGLPIKCEKPQGHYGRHRSALRYFRYSELDREETATFYVTWRNYDK